MFGIQARHGRRGLLHYSSAACWGEDVACPHSLCYNYAVIAGQIWSLYDLKIFLKPLEIFFFLFLFLILK